MFLKDTNPNKISGWQWPISVSNLESINVPLFVLGVGYNRFRGQDDFDSMFSENINAVVRKAELFGMRNYGSIEALKPYLSLELHQKLVYHPCATTVLSKIYDLPPKRNNGKFIIALNCAFDRDALRYGDDIESILLSISSAMKVLCESYIIKVYAHTAGDIRICEYLDRKNVSYELILLNKEMSVDELLIYYTSVDLVIGMRGHAQMIPFGCCTPILSLISHDKMGWFLDDIGHPEWGIDIHSDNLERLITEKALSLLGDIDAVIDEIKRIQDGLWDITVSNIEHMEKIRLSNLER